ncbi:MAG: Na+/H+ antiporter NhaA [Bdellovibrionota bacterium]|nr:MAG: Na+/H+ antiporter NhaA [Bdellovibrionota bacterium]
MKLTPIKEFLKLESAGGILLVVSAVLALIFENSALQSAYHWLLHTEVGLGGALSKPLHWWINDGLMVIFFLLVGLEIKRELLIGELSSRAQAMLPAVAALGGMLVPALFYLILNVENPETVRGWAIPAATDIAFSLGVLSLLGSRVPLSLKVFLTALAVIDDLGAVVIIALFYSENISLLFLGLSAAIMIVLISLGRLGVQRLTPYMLLGVLLWLCILQSGVHATVAGVCLALTIPLSPNDSDRSPLTRLEHMIHPWVAFGIMPIFAFANAGLSFEGLTLSALLDPLPLGIVLGLFLGKQLGIFAFSGLLIRFGIVPLPSGATWLQLYGVAALAGIGFTMSLFIGGLAFSSEQLLVETRLGVFVGSLLSALLGFFVLRISGSTVRE